MFQLLFHLNEQLTNKRSFLFGCLFGGLGRAVGFVDVRQAWVSAQNILNFAL